MEAVSREIEQKEPLTVVVLPFDGSRQGTYGYLHDAVRQMLVSRLVKKGDIDIVDYREDNVGKSVAHFWPGSEHIRQIFALSGADWLIAGEFSSQEGSMQVQIRLYPADRKGEMAEYHLRAASPDEVIPAIEALIAEMRGNSFYPAATDDNEGVGGHPAEAGVAGFKTPHPERDYKKGLYGGVGLFGGDWDDRFESRGIRKSAELPIRIESMVVGDFNGDGSQELAVASRSRIRLFSFKAGRFDEIAGYDFPPTHKIHVLNAARLNDAETDRLYVSANRGKHPSSSIFSWDGSDELQVINENIRWYIRPVTMADGKQLLVGQKASPNVSDRFLAPGVFQLVPDGSNGLKRGKKLLLPERTNLFDFVIADLNGDGAVETTVIDEYQKLLVYDETMSLIWVSSAHYGGSNRFFGPRPAENDDRDSHAYSEREEAIRQLVYIPGRMDVKDITGDGKPELVVSSNEVTGISEYFSNFRGYDGGSVACLSWRGSGLVELWRTNHIEGYVADYYFDGERAAGEDKQEQMVSRLFVAQVPDATFWSRFIPAGNKSVLRAYEMLVGKRTQKEQ